MISANVVAAAQEVAGFMDSKGWKCCLIGGLALQKWGEMRATQDADFTVLTEWGTQQIIIDAVFDAFAPRFSDAKQFAAQRNIMLIEASNGIPVDISLGTIPFEVGAILRSVPFEIAEGVVLPVCTAEDLFVMKITAGRPRDLEDLRGLVARQEHLDTKYILHHVKEISEVLETPEKMEMARKLLKL